MGANSSIEWTEATWNPVTGCTKISDGCRHCYAETLARRLKAMGQPNYVNGFEPTLHERMLDLPLHWKQPRAVFVNSMSDLFHDDVPDAFIHRVFETMSRVDRHRYQLLTKRSDRLCRLSPFLTWQPHIWMGVTVESLDYIERIDDLRGTGAAVKFLSIEPMLGPMPDLNLHTIDWGIVGGESGAQARPIEREWVFDIRDQCRRSGVALFFKQWGGRNKKKAGRMLDGRTWNEMP